MKAFPADFVTKEIVRIGDMAQEKIREDYRLKVSLEKEKLRAAIYALVVKTSQEGIKIINLPPEFYMLDHPHRLDMLRELEDCFPGLVEWASSDSTARDWKILKVDRNSGFDRYRLNFLRV